MLSDDADDSSGSARVFIVGFITKIRVNTNSTIAIGSFDGTNNRVRGHMSGRFIPTVERESIDLV